MRNLPFSLGRAYPLAFRSASTTMARKSLKRSPSSSLSPEPVDTTPKRARGKGKAASSKADAKAVKSEEMIAEAEGDPEHVNGSLGDEGKPPADGPPKKKARQSAAATSKAKEEKPKKIPKGKMWPPPDLDPSLHPARHGMPPFELEGGLSAASNGRPMLLGAHVSIGGGPGTALLRAAKAGANGLAMFVKNQRSWKSNPYDDEAIKRFKDLMKPVEEGGESCSIDPSVRI